MHSNNIGILQFHSTTRIELPSYNYPQNTLDLHQDSHHYQYPTHKNHYCQCKVDYTTRCMKYKIVYNYMCTKLFTLQLVSLQSQGGMLGPIQTVLTGSSFILHTHFTVYKYITITNTKKHLLIN